MKKPRKPKAKRPSAPVAAGRPAARATGAAALGPAAAAFLRRDPAPANRRPTGPSHARTIPRPAGAQTLSLGPAARAFLKSASPSPPARAKARTEAFDQREIVTLLLLPFFLLAFALGLSQTWRHPIRVAEQAPPAPSVTTAPPRTATPELPSPALRLPSSPPAIELPDTRQASLAAPVAPYPAPTPSFDLATPAPTLPRTAPAIEVPQVETPAIALARQPPPIEIPQVPTPPVVLAARAPQIDIPEVTTPALSLPVASPRIDVPEPITPKLALPAAAPPVEASVVASADVSRRPPPDDPKPEGGAPKPRLAMLPPGPRDTETMLPGPLSGPGQCKAEPGFGQHLYEVRAVAPGESFGERLAEAARAQTSGFVIYNDAYRRISFPMGDVPPLFGVCTDVIIRAYRALGFDLQELVQKAGIGSGDTNIDHRRTETLRRFFASRGQSLPVTSFPEDYQPGDIVTYHRPQNRHSRAHIAIVSDQSAPSGRPMIVHNRGWGPQLEDALFVDQITGHYRFRPGDNPILAAARRPVKTITVQRQIKQAGPKIAQRPADGGATTRAVSASQ